MSIRYSILIVYLFGAILLLIFAHEFGHWLQNPDIEEKHICFLGYGANPISYLYTPDHYFFETKEEHSKLELEANLLALPFFFLIIITFIKNRDAFIKE